MVEKLHPTERKSHAREKTYCFNKNR